MAKENNYNVVDTGKCSSNKQANRHIRAYNREQVNKYKKLTVYD